MVSTLEIPDLLIGYGGYLVGLVSGVVAIPLDSAGGEGGVIG